MNSRTISTINISASSMMSGPICPELGEVLDPAPTGLGMGCPQFAAKTAVSGQPLAFLFGECHRKMPFPGVCCRFKRRLALWWLAKYHQNVKSPRKTIF